MNWKSDVLDGGAIRASAEGEDCTLDLLCCDRDPANVVYCHLRKFHVGGMGMKPAEPIGVYACYSCHDALDGRSENAHMVTNEDVLRALIRTLLRLLDKGLL